jgi:hypothetical protein
MHSILSHQHQRALLARDEPLEEREAVECVKLLVTKEDGGTKLPMVADTDECTASAKP